MFSRKWKFEGSCTKKLDQKWKFAEMEIWVRIFCKRGRNGIPFYREWTVQSIPDKWKFDKMEISLNFYKPSVKNGNSQKWKFGFEFSAKGVEMEFHFIANGL